MSLPKVSVLIPCYNQGHLVEQAIDSALQQEGCEVEVIVVNDGSTDPDTNSILDRYNRPQVKVFKTANQGLASTRNFAFSQATGQFIQFLDADDVIGAGKFSSQLKVFSDQPEIDVCYSSYQTFKGDLNNLGGQYASLDLGSDPLESFLFRWEIELSIPIHCGLFRRSCWGDENPFVTGFRSKEDWIMWTHLALKNKKFQFINRELAFYRRHDLNMTNEFVAMNFRHLEAANFIKSKIPVSLRDRFEAHVNRYVSKNLEWFYTDTIKYNLAAAQMKVSDLHQRINVMAEEKRALEIANYLGSLLKSFVGKFSKKQQKQEKFQMSSFDNLTNYELAHIFFAELKSRISQLSADLSLQLLFYIEDQLYKLEGTESIRYGNGVHTKHRHTSYHHFFVRNIPSDARILDVGCGNGAMVHTLAKESAASEIYGIDLSDANIQFAKQNFSHEKIQYVCGNVLTDLPDKHFDVITMSNVLEHLPERVQFLTSLQKRYHPQKYLIRVPLFERDWRVPLKKELGAEWRLDDTHTEYTQEEFEEEMRAAGLKIDHMQIRWGEIWAQVSLR